MDKSVVRNAQYRRGGLSIRQRHNERQNIDYMNDDIIKERASYNVHFKKPTGSYEQMFDSLVADGTVSTRGLGKDPFIVDELVFDVNTSYFDRNGGYDYAVSFFEEAYRCAIEEIGGEQYVLSAVMHADERNKALSEQLGRDVYHYHLHVVYLPVVDKEIYYRKNNKNPELAGKLREVIKQVSHSKKWPKLKQYDENGDVILSKNRKPVLVNSYSLLQDHFYNHMTEAGFTGFERGERGSTAEHLEVLEFKAKKEMERVAAMETEVDTMRSTATDLENAVTKKQKKLDELEKKTATAKKEVATVEDVENMVRPIMLSSYLQLSPDDWGKVSNLAKEGVKSRATIKELRKKISGLENTIRELKQKLMKYEGMGITDKLLYIEAMRRAPKRLMDTIADIKRQPPEKQEQTRVTPEHGINRNGER